MKVEPLYLLLADDDIDDCTLFQDVLEELGVTAWLRVVYNGQQLMDLLHENNNERLPDILFLDLNMPRKNGFQCLREIKQDERLKNIPVVITSTSFQQDVVNMLFRYGAQYYIQKPNDFKLLKQVVYKALSMMIATDFMPPSKDHFVLSYEGFLTKPSEGRPDRL